MICPICKNNKIEIRHKQFPGYVLNNNFDIFFCELCDTQFVDTNRTYKKIYEKIYGNRDIPGYDRYFNQALAVKEKKNPLKYLAGKESSYYPVYKYLIDKKNLNILEIGSGYGYLTYSIYKNKHNVLGIDVSENVVKFANSNFGALYKNTVIENLDIEQKFDLIIATEVIEHLDDPVTFLKNCKRFLNNNGKILLTTPNKNYYPKNAVWLSDLPPVHTFWFSKKSFDEISKQIDMSLELFNYSGYFNKEENKLVDILRSFRKNYNLPESIIDTEGKIIKYGRKEFNFFTRLLKKLIRWRPIGFIFSFIGRFFHKENLTLAVFLSKKE